MAHVFKKQAAPRLQVITAAMLAAFGSCAYAQAEPVVMETVNVVGQAARMESALEKQRSADQIQSVVHADGIAQLPDDNVAESAQRLPGISVERDQGEGRFVSVRGLGPDLNAVTINGTLIPAPESDRRAVALDVLPAELVQSLSVIKSLTPDMDANSVGGTVAIESLSAFDHKEPLRTFSAEAGYDTNAGKANPKLSGAVTQKFSLGDGKDNFGIAAAFSTHRREFGSDNVETGGAWDFTDGAKLEEVEQRRYDIRRDRTGLGLNFDYRPDVTSKYYLRTLTSRYEDSETRHANFLEFDDAQSPGDIGPAEGERELKSRTEKQSVNSFVLGGEQVHGMWTVSAQAAYSRAEEDSPEGIAGATFVGGTFNGAGYTNSRKPNFTIEDAFYDPASFSLDEVEMERQITKDTEKNVRLDLSRDYLLGGYASQVKFGGKVSRREKTNDLTTWIYDGFGAEGAMTNFVNGSVDSGWGRFGPAIDAGAIRNLIGGLDRDAALDEEESRINDFRIKEDINAAYVMNTVDLDKWRIIAGLRYEGTSVDASGTGLEDGAFVAVNRSKDYSHWLPGLHATYQLREGTQVRAAWTNSVVRPTFEQLAPGFFIDSGDAKASFGNPDLKPLKSTNLDLGIEHYFGRASVVSAYVFYKRIRDFVYNTDLAGTGAWAAFDEALTFANGNKADLYGIELAYSQKFNWLPSPWNGLLLGANLTLSRSDADISGAANGEIVSRNIDLPNQSDTVGNLMIGWENNKLSTRLSANYKSAYLAQVAGIDDAAHDLYADSQLFVDFSARYAINKTVQIFFQAQNLTDEAYYVYTGSSAYNAQYEEYGPVYKLGVTMSF